jgi:hypothetical protein
MPSFWQKQRLCHLFGILLLFDGQINAKFLAKKEAGK